MNVSINTCESHDRTVVVYQGTKCPLCTANEDLEGARGTIEDLKRENNLLDSKCEGLEQELEEQLEEREGVE